MSANHRRNEVHGDGERLRTVTGMRILLSISAVIWTWALCWWMPFWFVIFYMTPFLLFVSWLIAWIVGRRIARWEYRWPGWRYHLYRTVIVVLIVAAPVSSYLYGRWIAHQFVRELGIEVRLVEQKVSVLEQFGFGERRGVLSIYELLEPQGGAEQKIRQRILAQGKPTDVDNPIAALGWQLGNQGLTFFCQSENHNHTDVRMNQNRQLVVHLLFYASPYCRLR